MKTWTISSDGISPMVISRVKDRTGSNVQLAGMRICQSRIGIGISSKQWDYVDHIRLYSRKRDLFRPSQCCEVHQYRYTLQLHNAREAVTGIYDSVGVT